MLKEEFRRLKLRERYELLKKRGKHLANRNHGGFQCTLYDFEGFYVEAWKPMGINIIQWIEIVNRDEIIDSYLDDLSLD